MQVTRKVNDKKNSDKKEFDFFNNRDQNNNIAGALNEVASKTSNGSMGSTDVVAAQIRKARDEDVEKVLRESNMDILTPDVYVLSLNFLKMIIFSANPLNQALEDLRKF